MAEDFTSADLKQNKEINSDTARIANLEQCVRELRAQQSAGLIVDNNHEVALKRLEPLHELVEFVEHIKTFFTSIRKIGEAR